MAKKKARRAAKAKRAKKGKRQYVCGVCGLGVSVDNICGCVTTCDIICCGEQMKPK